MSGSVNRLVWHKRLLQQSWAQAIAAWLIAATLKLSWLTFRLERHIHPDAEPYLRGEKHGIFCFWHGRMIMLPFFMPAKNQMHVLISQHRDGELIARLIAHFGIHSVRGSSSKGAKEATQALLGVLASGHNIAITPDGPRGPVFQASKGALHLARLSGCAMIPVSFSASRYKQLSSWDRFMIPLPFARIRVEFGAPIMLEKGMKLAQLHGAKEQLEGALNAANARADEVCA